MERCQAVKQDGSPCEAPPQENGYCFWHDPSKAEEARDARVLGGSHRKRTVCGGPFPGEVTDFDSALRFANELLRQAWELDAGANQIKVAISALRLAGELLEMRSLTEAELQVIAQRMIETVDRYIDDPKRRRAFIREVFQYMPRPQLPGETNDERKAEERTP